MAMHTICQTPDAVFHTRITNESLTVTVDFGKDLNLDEGESLVLEANVHNALEIVLAQYYVPARIPAAD